MLFDNHLVVFVPLALVIAFFLFVWDFKKSNKLVRVLISVTCLGLGSWYFWWRLTATVFTNDPQLQYQQFWTILVVSIEFLAFIDTAIFLITMSRVADRVSEANLLESRAIYDGALIDIFIPTYNESIEILEKTIISALNIDYKNKKIWVLDDSRRDWLKQYCSKLDVQYLTRENNDHAKAGNINNALKYAKGDFICIFDADFCPYRNFIKRTLGFFNEPSVGIVQTPQHFYNKDIVQTNLGLGSDFPDEQRLFFDEIQVSKDAWGVAFSCGSCSITRRAALDAIGGTPIESVTEDMLTTISMLRKGYKTVYLNEKLSMGLSADSILGFFIQRARWCKGSLQILFLKSGQLGPGLSLIQRVLFFPAYWLFNHLGRLLLLMVPIVYLFTGLQPLFFNSLDQLLIYQFPVYLASYLALRWFVRGKHNLLISTAISLFLCFRLVPVVIEALINPSDRVFKVTPKGGRVESENLTLKADRFTFFSILFVIFATIIGLVINSIPELTLVNFDSFFPVSFFWGFLNCVFLVIASLICFEGPRLRKEERFNINEHVSLKLENSLIDGTLTNVSLSGGLINIHKTTRVNMPHSVFINKVGWLKTIAVSTKNNSVAVKFDYRDESQKNAMIAKLYTGDFDNSVYETGNMNRVLMGLFKRAYN